MNATNQDGLRDRLGSFSTAMGVLALQSLDYPDWLKTAKRYERKPLEFAYCWEEEFARMLDLHQISWQYKHRTFAVEWDEAGSFADCFTPDFYIPAFDTYVELVAAGCGALGAKARKVRLLRQLHPDIRIELLSSASQSSLLKMFS